jgi:hypothetical protein
LAQKYQNAKGEVLGTLHTGRHSFVDEPAFWKYDVIWEWGKCFIIYIWITHWKLWKAFCWVVTHYASYATLEDFYPTWILYSKRINLFSSKLGETALKILLRYRELLLKFKAKILMRLYWIIIEVSGKEFKFWLL